MRLIALAGGRAARSRRPEAVARLSPRRPAERRCAAATAPVRSSRFARRVASRQSSICAAWERRETPADEVREAILAEHGFGPYAAEGLLRILGRHDYLALDSWVRQAVPPPLSRARRRPPIGAIARRYARFGELRGPRAVARPDARLARRRAGRLAVAAGMHTRLGTSAYARLALLIFLGKLLSLTNKPRHS